MNGETLYDRAERISRNYPLTREAVANLLRIRDDEELVRLALDSFPGFYGSAKALLLMSVSEGWERPATGWRKVKEEEAQSNERTAE